MGKEQELAILLFFFCTKKKKYFCRKFLTDLAKRRRKEGKELGKFNWRFGDILISVLSSQRTSKTMENKGEQMCFLKGF